MKVIGIDSGAGGAVAIVSDDEYAVELTPNIIVPKKTKRKKLVECEDGIKRKKSVSTTINERKLDEPAFIKMMTEIGDQHGYDTPVWIEKVGVMPQQGLVSTCNFITAYQFQRGVLATLGFTMHDVRPAIWKKRYKLNDSSLSDSQKKRKGLEHARILFPEIPLPLAKDHDKADALLIAKYGQLELS